MNEISNMKKLIDDHRYQNEELERQYNQKRNEMKDVESELDRIKQVMGKSSNDIEYYQKIIDDLEEKNKKLNEKLTEVMYNKASSYKQRTLQALRMSQSPERKERISEYGIANTSDKRLE